MTWVRRIDVQALALGLGIAGCGGVETGVEVTPSGQVPARALPGNDLGVRSGPSFGVVKKLGPDARRLGDLKAPPIEESLARLTNLELFAVGAPLTQITEETCLPYRECESRDVQLAPEVVAQRVARLAEVAASAAAEADTDAACPGMNGCWGLDEASVSESLEVLRALQIVEVGEFEAIARPEDAACYFTCCENDKLNCEKAEELRKVAEAVQAGL
ncbi:MAG: hypothetical protein HYV07_05645 [Deltaproteobacteria bacterium]|nr:hypothetical protein [Deltaproteobacteria bacterium]